jgi:hypothetical protein
MQPANRSSGLKTADGVIQAKPTIISGIHINTDGTNDALVVLHDHASAASGTVVFQQTVTGADDSIPFNLPDGGVYCKNGVYANITTSGTMSFIVYFR